MSFDDAARAASEDVALFFRGLRQLICIHGPIKHVDYAKPSEETGAIGFDFCERCGKTTGRYYSE